MCSLPLLLSLASLGLTGGREEVTFTLGPLGPVTGVTTTTSPYPDAPHSRRPLYKFRNLPYIEGSIAGPNRFTQSSVRLSPYTDDGTSYDATRSGPLCMQGTLGTLHLEDLFQQTLEDFILSILPPLIGDLESTRVVVEVLLQVIEIFVEVPEGTLDGKKQVVTILHDWLDIDFSVAEECLSLSVWTPVRPDGEERRNLPVMYYIFGGGFNSGFSYKMGGERLAAFEDVVVVAINYRLGPLGFLCLDTEGAAGNMALLDMVVGLEWVREYIAYFGGDPLSVTLFGDSAGAASAGHLMLSQEAAGLFHQAIGSSGSPLGSWAWDSQQAQEPCSRDIAARVGCSDPDPDELVACLREVEAADITKAFSAFQAEQRGNASMGYCGTQPCGQTRGPRIFYPADTTPTEIVLSGKYHPVPVLYGAAKDEGSFVYGTLHNEWMEAANLTLDDEFLRFDVIPTLLRTVGVTQYYAVKELLRDTYFDPESLGDLQAMIPGFTDLLSVFFIKAAAYELVQLNSLRAPSYWYDFAYDSPLKHLYNVMFLGSPPSGVDFPGATHCENIPYIFDVEIPLIFCNLTEVITDALHCMDGLDAIFCLTLPGGEFRSKWQDCLTGHLAGEDLQVSANTARTFAGFAARGQPGAGLGPWSRAAPHYLRIDKVLSVETDYTLQYNIALEQSRNRTRRAGRREDPC